MLEWVAYPFSSGSFSPRDQTRLPALQADSSLSELSGKPLVSKPQLKNILILIPKSLKYFSFTLQFISLQNSERTVYVLDKICHRLIQWMAGYSNKHFVQFSSIQSLSHVWLLVTSWTVALQASLSITNSQSLVKLMSIESVMPSNHLIICYPLLLLPSIFSSIRVFVSESLIHIRWPKYWSFSFSISPSNEYSGLISFRMDWLELLAV